MSRHEPSNRKSKGRDRGNQARTTTIAAGAALDAQDSGPHRKSLKKFKADNATGSNGRTAQKYAPVLQAWYFELYLLSVLLFRQISKGFVDDNDSETEEEEK